MGARVPPQCMPESSWVGSAHIMGVAMCVCVCGGVGGGGGEGGGTCTSLPHNNGISHRHCSRPISSVVSVSPGGYVLAVSLLQGSRPHYCINQAVIRKGNIDAECEELNKDGMGCKYKKNANSLGHGLVKVRSTPLHYLLHLALHPAGLSLRHPALSLHHPSRSL
jgi:hypothetical protein